MATFKTIEEWAKQFLDKATNVRVQKAYQKAVFLTIPKIGKRIFEKGIGADGSGIGHYAGAGRSGKPMYIGNQRSPRKGTLRGKYGDKKFKNGFPHVTTYYRNYYQFRVAMGRTNPFVNLTLSGRLYRNFLNSFDNSKGFKRVGTGIVKPVKKNPYLYTIELRPDNMAKARGSEIRFRGRIKTIFAFTKAERKEFNNLVSEEFIKALKV